MRRRERRVLDAGVEVPQELVAGWSHPAWVDDAADLAMYAEWPEPLSERAVEVIIRGGRIRRYRSSAQAFALEQGWVSANGKRADWLRLEEVGIRRPRARDRFDPRPLLTVGTQR